MKPEFKFKGNEATPGDYSQLMQALLASQAATPTAKACIKIEKPAPLNVVDALFGDPAAGAKPSRAARRAAQKNGEQAVYPRISGFLEADDATSAPSGPRTKPASDRYE